MRLLALILLALGTVAAAEDHQPLVITAHLCPVNKSDSRECQQRRAEWLRVKDEADLHALIIQDFKNQIAGQLDISLRARITAICKRLAKNEY